MNDRVDQTVIGCNLDQCYLLNREYFKGQSRDRSLKLIFFSSLGFLSSIFYHDCGLYKAIIHYGPDPKII